MENEFRLKIETSPDSCATARNDSFPSSLKIKILLSDSGEMIPRVSTTYSNSTMTINLLLSASRDMSPQKPTTCNTLSMKISIFYPDSRTPQTSTTVPTSTSLNFLPTTIQLDRPLEARHQHPRPQAARQMNAPHHHIVLMENFVATSRHLAITIIENPRNNTTFQTWCYQMNPQPALGGLTHRVDRPRGASDSWDETQKVEDHQGYNTRAFSNKGQKERQRSTKKTASKWDRVLAQNAELEAQLTNYQINEYGYRAAMRMKKARLERIEKWVNRMDKFDKWVVATKKSVRKWRQKTFKKVRATFGFRKRDVMAHKGEYC
jgi:hypothetical protein